jgi:hypothetical protein
VPGNLRLRDVQNLDQVADANLAPVHQVKQAQTRRVS